MSVALVFIVLFFLLGLSLGPLLVAVLSQALSSSRAQGVASWALGVGLAAIHKPVLTFNASSDLTLKQRQYDEKHDSEYLSFGGLTSSVKRALFDRPDRFHSFYGTPFAFVDERFGVPVDPRDVDTGRNLRRDRQHSRYEHRVQDGNRLIESVKAYFERPRGHIGVRLAEVTALYGGSLDSKSLDKVREYYRQGQAPKDQTSGMLKLMIPVGAFIAVILMGMFAGGGGGGGAPAPSGDGNSTIEVGLALIGMALPRLRSDDDPDDDPDDDGSDDAGGGGINWRDVLVGLFGLVIGGGMIGLLLLAFPNVVPILGIPLPLGLWCALFLGLGVALPPVIARWFGRSLGPIGMALGKLYLIIGLLAYNRPVIEYDDGRYHVVEYGDHDFEVEPYWYRFAFSRVGVAFRNAPDNWPEGTTMGPEKTRTLAEAGSQSASPSDMVRTDEIAVGNIHGLVPQPDDVDDDAVYVRTDRTTGVLEEAGKDRRTLQQAIQQAKQDYGGGETPVDDKWIVGATVVSMGMAGLVLMVM